MSCNKNCNTCGCKVKEPQKLKFNPPVFVVSLMIVAVLAVVAHIYLS